MAPGVDLMTCATPPLPLAAWALAASSVRNLVKLAVVPEESERTAMAIAVLGRVTPELSAAIAGSFHFVILPSKMPAITGADSCSGLLRPDRLYESVIGPTMTGK